MEWSMEVWNGVWKYGMEYGSMEWSMEEYLWHGVEDRMEKNVGMEYEKIIFHSVPLHALDIRTNTTSICIRIVVRKSIARIRNIPRGVQFYFTHSSNVKFNISGSLDSQFHHV